jgi:8-oxo-dGTP diphosphatase
MEYTAYTVALALRCGNKLWMSQRVNTINFPGKWQFPGGKLSENENPIDGAVRETKEETNLDITEKRLRYAGSIDGDPTTYICYVYYVDLNEAEIPVRTENKMTDWQRLSYDEALKKDLMPGLPEIIEKLRTLK